MTATHVGLALVIAVVVRWSMDLVVTFVTSCVFCTVMIDYELVENFSKNEFPLTRKR